MGLSKTPKSVITVFVCITASCREESKSLTGARKEICGGRKGKSQYMVSPRQESINAKS